MSSFLLHEHTFLSGPAGCGKTTAAVQHLLRLLDSGVPGRHVLIFLPQRTLGTPYLEALHNSPAAGGPVTLLTLGGMARRMVELFWPLVAEQAGFAHPERLPTFLTLETAQYYMAHLVRPLLDEGYFESVTIDRNRLYSQIIDNLNKAAVVGFPHSEIGARLSAAASESGGQTRVYQDAQACASLFRRYCLENNLLDFSLQVEVFTQHLWDLPICRDLLQDTYQHLIYDNIEEDTPIAHDLVSNWLTNFESALLIYDEDAGYRRFLGADPQSALRLRDPCRHQVVMDESFVCSLGVISLTRSLVDRIRPTSGSKPPLPEPDPRQALEVAAHRFYPQMLDWVCDQVAWLVHEQGLPPGEIAILAPYLSDALRFTLVHRLENRGVSARSHRPSRSLREEPAAQCLLTLAMIAHPNWGIAPGMFEVSYALMQAIEGLDLVRAQMLTQIVYRPRQGIPVLTSFEQIIPESQERITYILGERYDYLQRWINDYAQEPPIVLDHFFSRLFGEVLAQPGFGFHAAYDAGQAAANLIESAQKFRWVAAPDVEQDSKPLGKEYIQMVKDGIIAAQYLLPWQTRSQDALLIAPAYTFLMSNRPVEVQFWLDIGSRAWAERLEQPLTHPYVLSRGWADGAQWSTVEELETAQDNLYRLTNGLLRRCRSRLYLGLSELGEQGFEQRGPLLSAFQRLLRDCSSLDGLGGST
ncbi:MAG: hypothetical protein JW726_11895 [Anaerolineales bacterium]|nr:hypothetical protein [Anaerolineales bacterium]